MISLLPNTTAQDTTGAFAVLAVLADPKAAQKRLQDLVEAAQKHEAAINEHGKVVEAAVKAKAEADAARAAIADREAAVKTREDDIVALERQLADREAAIKGKEDAIAKADAENRAAVAELAAKAAADAKTAAEMKAQASADRDAAASLKYDYEQKIARIKSAVG